MYCLTVGHPIPNEVLSLQAGLLAMYCWPSCLVATGQTTTLCLAGLLPRQAGPCLVAEKGCVALIMKFTVGNVLPDHPVPNKY
jgi:hypothetical protein